MPALQSLSKSQTHTRYTKLRVYKIHAREGLLWQHITVQQKPLNSPAGHLCLRRLHLRRSVSPNCSASCLGPRRGPTCAAHSKDLINHIVCYLSRWKFCHPILCFTCLLPSLNTTRWLTPSTHCQPRVQIQGRLEMPSLLLANEQEYLGRNETTTSACAAVSTHSVNIRRTACACA